MRLELLNYSTGWDYKITHGDLSNKSAIHIQAHAPSLVSLKCLDDGWVGIKASVMPGGNNIAIPSINKKPISYGDINSLQLHINDIIELSCATDDKNGNWNYWTIMGSEMVAPSKLWYTAVKHSHLGDAISIMVGLNSFAVDNNCTIDVSGSVFKDLMNKFEFQNLRYRDGEPFNVDELYGTCSWNEPWLKRFRSILNNRIGGKESNSLIVPKGVVDITPGDDVLCQFDSRSAAVPPIDKLKRIIKTLAGDNKVAAIGGVDTTRYLDEFEYRLGNLDYIIDQLAKCRYFIGCDSGMAHLAGIMGVKSYVVNYISSDSIIKMFGEYPNTTLIDMRLFDII